jgi:hypothetical protein
MAAAGPWGGLVGGVGGALLGWGLGDKAADAREEASKEELRRFDIGAAQKMGEATAAVGASGVEFGGSMTQYLAQMGNEFRRQREWAAGQAGSAKSLDEATNYLTMASGIGSSLAQFGKSKNWWQQPSSGGA